MSRALPSGVWEQGLDPETRITCKVCGQFRKQFHFALAWPRERKLNGRSLGYWVKVSRVCRKCRPKKLSKKREQRVNVAHSFVRRMSRLLNAGDKIQAYQLAALTIRRLGGVDRLAIRIAGYFEDATQAGKVGVDSLLATLHDSLQQDLRDLAAHRDAAQEELLPLLNEEQLRDEQYHQAREIVRRNGNYILKDRSGKRFRDRTGMLPGRVVFRREINRLDRRVAGGKAGAENGDKEAGSLQALEKALAELRRQYLQALKVEGEAARVTLGLAVERM